LDGLELYPCYAQVWQGPSGARRNLPPHMRKVRRRRAGATRMSAAAETTRSAGAWSY